MALLATEGVELEVTPEASRRARPHRRRAQPQRREHRRPPPHDGVERVLEDVSFSASERRGTRVVLDAAGVRTALAPLLGREDLARYIL